MIVYEFYLKDAFKTQPIKVLCKGFINLGNCIRKINGLDAPCIYAMSRDLKTHWVQLMLDDNTPSAIFTAFEARIQGLCDTTFQKYSSDQDFIAPKERSREEIGI